MGTRVSYYQRSLNLISRACKISENTLTLKDDDSGDDDYYYYLDSEDRQNRGRSAAAKVSVLCKDGCSTEGQNTY